jgi:hypothetical protein
MGRRRRPHPCPGCRSTGSSPSPTGLTPMGTRLMLLGAVGLPGMLELLEVDDVGEPREQDGAGSKSLRWSAEVWNLYKLESSSRRRTGWAGRGRASGWRSCGVATESGQDLARRGGRGHARRGDEIRARRPWGTGARLWLLPLGGESIPTATLSTWRRRGGMYRACRVRRWVVLLFAREVVGNQPLVCYCLSSLTSATLTAQQ